jgi:hypothetical protein
VPTEAKQATPDPSQRARGWIRSVRSAPFGVLVLAAALCFVGVGFILAGVYLAFTSDGMRWPGWAMLLVAAPVSLYVAFHLVRRTRWTWTAMVAALVLLLISSVLRALFSPGIPIAALSEIALELLFLHYLSRRRIRTAFGR